MQLFDEIFHADARWHIAVTPYDQSEPPVFQSPLLRDQKVPWDKTIMNKQEMMAVFDLVLSAFEQFSLEITSTIVEGDTLVAESQGRAVNPQNGRVYNNIYCHVMKVRDEKIVLFSGASYAIDCISLHSDVRPATGECGFIGSN